MTGSIHRVAFGSCVYLRDCPVQATWDHIRAREPDHVLLLGDQIYMDFRETLGRPRKWDSARFAREMYERYRDQWSEARFNQFIRSLHNDRVSMTWDDHDFAWNNSVGGKGSSHDQVPPAKQWIARNLFEQFRDAVARPAAAYPAPPFDLDVPPAGSEPITGVYSSRDVGDVRIVMVDLRTFCDAQGAGDELFGPAQWEWLVERVATAPGRDIIVGSSVTLDDAGGWIDHPSKRDAFLEVIHDHGKRLVVLSGDIHVERFRMHPSPFQGHSIFEATSSGLAIIGYKLAWRGRLQNYGIVTIDPARMMIDLYRRDDELYQSRIIDRNSWTWIQ